MISGEAGRGRDKCRCQHIAQETVTTNTLSCQLQTYSIAECRISHPICQPCLLNIAQIGSIMLGNRIVDLLSYYGLWFLPSNAKINDILQFATTGIENKENENSVICQL